MIRVDITRSSWLTVAAWLVIAPCARALPVGIPEGAPVDGAQPAAASTTSTAIDRERIEAALAMARASWQLAPSPESAGSQPLALPDLKPRNAGLSFKGGELGVEVVTVPAARPSPTTVHSSLRYAWGGWVPLAATAVLLLAGGIALVAWRHRGGTAAPRAEPKTRSRRRRSGGRTRVRR